MSIRRSGKPVVIVVDGIIGAGKTVFIRDCLIPQMTKMGLKVTEVKEPVDLWKKSGRLQQFYADPRKRAYQFQTGVFHDRIMECRKAHTKHQRDTDIFLLERSIFTDVLFMNMLLNDELIDHTEHEDYHKMWAMWRELMPFTPDLFVYLRPDLEECMKRLQVRNRAGESGVSHSYQENLLKEHDKFLSGDSVLLDDDHHVPLLILETNQDFRTDSDVQRDLTTRVVEVVSNMIASVDIIVNQPADENGERGPR